MHITRQLLLIALAILIMNCDLASHENKDQYDCGDFNMRQLDDRPLYEPVGIDSVNMTCETVSDTSVCSYPDFFTKIFTVNDTNFIIILNLDSTLQSYSASYDGLPGKNKRYMDIHLSNSTTSSSIFWGDDSIYIYDISYNKQDTIFTRVLSEENGSIMKLYDGDSLRPVMISQGGSDLYCTNYP